MAIVSSTTGAQSALQQLSLQQAQRNADQAQQTAAALRGQANSAQAEADQARQTARSLQIRASEAENVAGTARQNLASAKSFRELPGQLSAALNTAVQGSNEAPASPPTPNAQPVINAQGQATGTLINVTA